MLKLMSIHNTNSIDAVEDNIGTFIREIPAEMLNRVRQNWTKRMEMKWNSNKDFIHLS